MIYKLIDDAVQRAQPVDGVRPDGFRPLDDTRGNTAFSSPAKERD